MHFCHYVPRMNFPDNMNKDQTYLSQDKIGFSKLDSNDTADAYTKSIIFSWSWINSIGIKKNYWMFDTLLSSGIFGNDPQLYGIFYAIL